MTTVYDFQSAANPGSAVIEKQGKMGLRRVLVLGSSGSGKTTFSNQLGKCLEIEIIHLDMFYWQPNWVEPANDHWEKILEDLLKRESWVMDGNYTRTLEWRLKFADSVVFLDIPRAVCLWRCFKRLGQYWGRVRPDLPEGCYEKMDWDFFLWIWNYPKRSRHRIMQILADQHTSQQIYILKSDREVQRFLESVGC